MSSLDRPVRRAIYLAVLSASEPSPLLPETGDEPRHVLGAAERLPNPPRAAAVREDRFRQDRAANHFPERASSRLQQPEGRRRGNHLLHATGRYRSGSALRLQKYQLKERSAATFLEGVRSYTLSGDRKKLLYQAARGGTGAWFPRTSPRNPATARSKWTTFR